MNRRIIAAAVYVLSVPIARGGEPDTTTAVVSFWRCSKPANIVCIKPDDEQVAGCGKCDRWDLETAVVADAEARLKRHRYPGQANRFIHDVLVELYRLSPKEAEQFTPNQLSNLYDNPGSFGWIELDRPRVGAIVLDRETCGLVPATDTWSTITKRQPWTWRWILNHPMTLIHPSKRHGGAVRTSDTKFLFPDVAQNGTPIIIFPSVKVDFKPPPGERASVETVPVVARRPVPGVPRGENISPLLWNAWIENEQGPRYRAIKRMVPAPGRAYTLAIHLSPRPYEGNVFAQTISPTWQAELERLRGTTQDVEVTILAVPDDRFLKIRDPITSMKVRVDRIDRWRRDPSGVPGNILHYLANKGDPERVVFGAATLRVEPTGLMEGQTTVGLSIWSSDGYPIDEVRVPICVATGSHAKQYCQNNEERSSGGGYEFPRQHSQSPDAALHVFSLGESGVIAVFHRNDTPNAFYAWKFSPSEHDLLDGLTELTDSFGKKRDDEAEILRLGGKLYTILFAVGDRDNLRAQAARTAFDAFVSPRVSGPAPPAETAPLFYLRFLQNRKLHESRQLPLALLNQGSSSDSFLGFHFRVESPLPRESVALNSCISDWLFVVPSLKSKEFGATREKLNGTIPTWLHGEVFQRMRDFRNWISMSTTEQDPMALAILSHHEHKNGRGRLTIDFDDDDDGDPNEPKDVALLSDEVIRTFGKPSIAILNGCGTAQPGAEDFINAFNRAGIDTIIATRHTVSKDMAADYFTCLSKQLEVAPGTLTLGQVHYKTVQCLRSQAPYPDARPYGPAAIAYGIFGNTDLRLCQPGGE